MAAHQAPPSLGFSRQEHWSALSFPSPTHESEKWKWSCSVVPDCVQPHRWQPTRLLHPWDFSGKSTGVGCHCLLHGMIYMEINMTLTSQILNSLRYMHIYNQFQGNYIFYFYLFSNWWKIGLKVCIGFCCTTTQISHNYICISSLLSFPPLILSHTSSSSQSTRLGSLCYLTTSYYLVYIWWCNI